MDSNWSTLHVKVRDKKSKTRIPVRFHIKRKDGSCFVPPLDQKEGRDKIPKVIVNDHFRKCLHLCQSAQLQSAHLTSGEAVFPVPAEELKIYIARGYEREPISRTFVAKPNKTTHLEFDMDTFESVAKEGWYSGDMHIHYTREVKRDDLILAHLMAAEELYAVNNMVYKHVGKVEAPQRNMGHRGNHHELAHHHQVIAGGEEYRDDDMFGHMISAGISKVIEPISVGHRLGRRENYPLFQQVCDWTHDQGGIAGWAHGGVLIKLHESLPVEAALRKLDFIEGIQFNHFMGFYFWYRLLNCGLKLATTGGSDFPFGSHILAPWYINLGLDRTFVHIDKNKKFTYRAYIEGIRNGRCFSSNGPLLFFEVNGNGPGSSIAIGSTTDKVKIFARAACQYPIDRLEIVVNGAVELMIDGKGGSREIVCETELSIPESAWVAARVRGRVEPEVYGGRAPWNLHAHSSPIYIEKGGRPILSRADATMMADYVRLITEIYRRSGYFKKESQRNALTRNMKKALAFYEGLLKK